MQAPEGNVLHARMFTTLSEPGSLPPSQAQSGERYSSTGVVQHEPDIITLAHELEVAHGWFQSGSSP